MMMSPIIIVNHTSGADHDVEHNIDAVMANSSAHPAIEDVSSEEYSYMDFAEREQSRAMQKGSSSTLMPFQGSSQHQIREDVPHAEVSSDKEGDENSEAKSARGAMVGGPEGADEPQMDVPSQNHVMNSSVSRQQPSSTTRSSTREGGDMNDDKSILLGVTVST